MFGQPLQRVIQQPVFLSIAYLHPLSKSTPTTTPSVTPSPTPAQSPAPNDLSISINSSPDSANLGDSFFVEFNVQNANPDTNYYVKAFGGTADNYSIQTQSNNDWYNFNSPWSSFSQFTTDNNGHLQSSLTVRAKPDQETGQYQLKIKFKEVDGSQEKESEAREISIFAPDSNPTVTKTPTLTKKITPTKTKTPTPSPSTTPSPTPAGIDTISSDSDPSILGDQDINADSTTSSKKSKPTNLIPKIFIGLGTLFLLVPVLITKIKKC